VISVGEAFPGGVAHLGLTVAIKRMFQGCCWQRVTEMLRMQFPIAVPVMKVAREDVLAFLHIPQELAQDLEHQPT